MRHKNIVLYAFLTCSFFTSWTVEAGKELTLFQEDRPQKQRSLTLSHTHQSREPTYFPPLSEPPLLQVNPRLQQDFYPYGSQNTMKRFGRSYDILPLEVMSLDSLKHLPPDRLRRLPQDRARQIAKTSVTLWSIEQWVAIVNAADFQQIPAIQMSTIQRPIGRNLPQRSLQDERQRRDLKHSPPPKRKLFRPLLPYSLLGIPDPNHIAQLPFIRQTQKRGVFPRRPFCGGAGFKK